MIEHKKSLVLHEFAASELSIREQKLLKLVEANLSKAYAPYSNFPVSAALTLKNGETLTGTNQENAAYPSGLCAERVALFFAGSQYPNVAINELAITIGKEINTFPFPCGSCLQVISETENRQGEPIKIMLYNRYKKHVLVANGVEQLLPFAFKKAHLG